MQIHFLEQDTTLEQEQIQPILEQEMLQLEAIITVLETATAIIILPEIAQITIIIQQEVTALLQEAKA